MQDVLNEELGEVKRIQTTLAGLRQPSSQERQSYDGFPMGGHVKKDPDVWDPPPPRSKILVSLSHFKTCFNDEFTAVDFLAKLILF